MAHNPRHTPSEFGIFQPHPWGGELSAQPNPPMPHAISPEESRLIEKAREIEEHLDRITTGPGGTKLMIDVSPMRRRLREDAGLPVEKLSPEDFLDRRPRLRDSWGPSKKINPKDFIKPLGSPSRRDSKKKGIASMVDLSQYPVPHEGFPLTEHSGGAEEQTRYPKTPWTRGYDGGISHGMYGHRYDLNPYTGEPYGPRSDDFTPTGWRDPLRDRWQIGPYDTTGEPHEGFPRQTISTEEFPEPKRDSKKKKSTINSKLFGKYKRMRDRDLQVELNSIWGDRPRLAGTILNLVRAAKADNSLTFDKLKGILKQFNTDRQTSR